MSAVLVLELSPGPDLLLIVAKTLAHGRRTGCAAGFGICAGASLHVIAAALGLSAILVSSAAAFTVVKWAGAAYLIWLGITTLSRRAARPAVARDANPVPSWGMAFRQGLLIDLLNPKVAIFFMAFLPQFVDPSIGQVPLQLLFLGGLVVIIGLAVTMGFVFSAGRLTTALHRRPRVGSWLNRLFGCVLIGLGVRLALQKQT